MYGLPSAAGARDSPTSPATAKIVTTYGSISMNSLGTGEPMMLERVLQVGREAEQQRGERRADGVPAAEDHRGERDEARTARHLLAERDDRREREVRAAEAGDRARERDVPEPGPR